MPDTDEDGAVKLAERMRAAVEKTPLYIADSKVIVTVSIGVVTINESHTDLESVLLNADEALYEAKNTGRNNVTRYA